MGSVISWTDDGKPLEDLPFNKISDSMVSWLERDFEGEEVRVFFGEDGWLQRTKTRLFQFQIHQVSSEKLLVVMS